MVLPLLRLHDVRGERKALMAIAICGGSGDVLKKNNNT